MKTALVIHPRMTILGGGEILCMHVCKALQEAGYKVILACDEYNPERMEEIFGFGDVMKKCEHFYVPPFKWHIIRRFLVLQRLPYARRTRRLFKDLDVDLVFSTQSTLFAFPGKKLYHYVYEIADLYAYGGPGTIPGVASFKGTLQGAGYHWQAYYWAARQLRKLVLGKNPHVTHFYCISHKVLNDMRLRGYENSSLLYPPCTMRYKPAAKNNYRIVQQVRIVPTKNLEMFIDIARKIPGRAFFLVGRGSEFYPGYQGKLLKDAPGNLVFVETPLKDRPDYLEEAKVYLYTAYEHGITISILEALGAGCIPVGPVDSGAADVISETIGYTFSTVDEAVKAVEMALSNPTDPWKIREMALKYSAENFEESIKKLAALNYHGG